MNSFFTGLLFLTRLPIKYDAEWTPAARGRSVKYFALIGAVLGIINVFAAFFLLLVLPVFNLSIPPLAGAFLLLLVNIASTGALHCDGYTDTMDGLLSGREKSRMLEIMKDSHVGAHGVTSLIMLLLGKYSVIVSIYPSAGASVTEFYTLGSALFLMPVIARLSMVLGITLFPYARREGLGKAFADYAGKKSLFWVFITVLVFLPAAYANMYHAAAALLGVIVFALLFCRHVTAKLGGLTGDVYGAVTELSELLVLLIFAVH
ncbi:adenosylcobinamide-GDP ribazoletransferase [Pectinatus haikarae]|uniref:Adenosylcobinamide-GDP ribazoletransferase n=1 Tax=Pectinatus haikarae TaxID=349096 RepID=A0ABT9Y6L9_9FIRM|nr:adenosylcobinamide-GDP ribazoletransferase [Pectinatus haikarae]MDQ0203191.1 adenosylcobinamide-GDP ribazoletransferase [Pectinatus haikarae]